MALRKQIAYVSADVQNSVCACQTYPYMENMKKAMIIKEDGEAAVREHGVEKCEEVNLAVMEVDGNRSGISENYVNKSVRKRRAHKVLRQQN